MEQLAPDPLTPYTQRPIKITVPLSAGGSIGSRQVMESEPDKLPDSPNLVLGMVVMFAFGGRVSVAGSRRDRDEPQASPGVHESIRNRGAVDKGIENR